MDCAGGGVIDSDCQHKDQGSNDDVAGICKIYFIFHDVSYADCGDHTVEDQGYTADGCGRHGRDQCSKLRAEGDEDGKTCSDADHAGIVDLCQSEDTRVFTVGGVCRCTEERGERCCKAVTEQCAVKAGILHVIAFTGGGDGTDIADMLNHGCKRERNNGKNGCPEQVRIKIPVEKTEDGAVPVDGKAEPFCLADSGSHVGTGCGIDNHGKKIGHQNTEKDRHDLGHSFAPHIEADYHCNGNHGDKPVGFTVCNGGRRKGKANCDDDRAGNNGREIAHDFFYTEGFEKGSQNNIHQSCNGNTEAGVRQKCRITVWCNGGVPADESERAAQESRNFAAGYKMEQQCAETCEQQCCCNVKAGQCRDKNGCAEHGKHVLNAENQHFRCSEGTCVIDYIVYFLRFSHSLKTPYINNILEKRMSCRSAVLRTAAASLVAGQIHQKNAGFPVIFRKAYFYQFCA